MVVFMFLLWVGFNGALTLEIALFGIAICTLMCLFCVKTMGYSLEWELMLIRMLPSILKFIGILIVEILKANRDVARFILTPGKKPEPTMIDFTPEIRENPLLVLLANAITLTPGTITYRLEYGEVCAHCLDSSMAKGMDESRFVQQIMAMEAKMDHARI